MNFEYSELDETTFFVTKNNLAPATPCISGSLYFLLLLSQKVGVGEKDFHEIGCSGLNVLAFSGAQVRVLFALQSAS